MDNLFDINEYNIDYRIIKARDKNGARLKNDLCLASKISLYCHESTVNDQIYEICPGIFNGKKCFFWVEYNRNDDYIHYEFLPFQEGVEFLVSKGAFAHLWSDRREK